MLPKKGTRAITVGDHRYRWTVRPAEFDRSRHRVLVQHERGGQQIVAHVAGVNLVSPRLIRRLIDRAARSGWAALEGSGQLELTVDSIVALSGERLGAILDALRTDEHERALVAALDCWRGSHITAVADVIDRISEVLRDPARRYDEAGWRALTAGDAALAPEAFDFVFTADPDVTAERAVALSRARPDDPRVARSLFEGLCRPIHAYGPGAQALLEAALEIFSRSGDYRVLEALRGEGRTALAGHAFEMRSWFEVRVSQAIRTLERSFPLGEPYLIDAAASLEAIQVQLGLSPPSAPAGAADLLRAISADPTDCDLRRVYADLLLDAGDPRGEMIHLQLEDELQEEARARLEQLLELHSDRWLGSLRGWLEQVRFERGFPSKGTLTWRVLVEECDVDDPSWATIEELGLPFRNVDSDPFLTHLQRLFASGAMRSLETVHHASVEVVEVLARIEGLRIQNLHVGGVNQLDGYPEACERLIRALGRGLAHLTRLELASSWPPDLVERLRSALRGRASVAIRDGV